MQKSVYEYVSKQTNDPIVEWKTCRISGTEFPIYKSDLEFYDKISPVIKGKKYQIQTPTLCPEERQRRRLMFRNERKLYKRKCDFSGKEIVSIYSPDKPYKVYDQKIWRSDQRDPMKYGKNFDFTKTFNDQFGELLKEVPNISLFNTNTENSEYVNYTEGSKNSYLSSVIYYQSEDILYSYWLYHSKYCVDCAFGNNIESCYQLLDSINCYNCFYSNNLLDCQNCLYSSNLEGCTNCFGCNNLVGKHFYINNQQYTKEEYFEKTKKTENKPHNDLSIFPATKNKNAKESFGSYLTNTENVVFGFDIQESKDCRYCGAGMEKAKDVYDSIGGSFELAYETNHTGFGTKFICTNGVLNSSIIFYSYNCLNSQNLFGCIGLSNKQYCIFNKQYTKEEYEILVPKIIEHMQTTGEWGEFFDPNLSPFGYNESVAYEYLPLTKEEALAKGYKRQDNNYDPVIPKGMDTIKGDQIPGDISIVTDDILKKIFICEVSERPFRIIKQELDFYRKHNLPLPRKHPDVRHLERIKLRSPRNLCIRTCDKCKKEILSVYPKDYIGNVYCETCYNKEIYG